MQFDKLLLSIISVFVFNVTAFNIFEKALILHDYPLCGTVCSGKVAKKLSVSYFDGRGNCARPDYQYHWKQCIEKYCFGKDRRKVRYPASK
jgi:hypothetical protein